MKTRSFYWITIGLIALMTIFSLDAFAKKGKRKKDAPDVVCIHLGEKNPTFDEEAYPDLEFFYAPKIVLTGDHPDGGWKAEGTPEVLVPWVNARIKGRKIGIKKLATVQKVEKVGIRNHYGILFDKNDIAAWEGTITNNDPGMAEVEGWIRGSGGAIVGKKKSVQLVESLKKIVRKGKTSKVAKGKTFEPGKRNPVVGIKMPDFDVTSSAGKTESINSIISGNKAPTLVMFFHIPPSAEIAGKEVKVLADDEPFSFKALAKAVKAPTAGSGHIMIFEAIEEQFFGHRRYPR